MVSVLKKEELSTTQCLAAEFLKPQGVLVNRCAGWAVGGHKGGGGMLETKKAPETRGFFRLVGGDGGN